MPVADKTVKFSDLCGFHEKQWEGIAAVDAHKYTFYGGAKGGGKSYWLRWTALRLLLNAFIQYGLKNVRVMLACETYRALKDRQLVKIQTEFPSWLGHYRVSDDEYHLNPEYGGGVIAFRNLDDPDKYHSVEYAAILVDELPNNTEDVFQILRSLLRWPGLPDEECKFIGTGNPQGVGIGWVKRLWIDKSYNEGEHAKDFCFVQARAYDNPKIASGYIDTLRSLPEQLRRAYLDGDWNVFRGQFFTEWREAIHTCAPFPIPRQWHKYRSLDFGTAKQSAVVWGALSPDGILYIYREFYRPTPKASDLAESVLALTETDEKVLFTVADPAVFKDSSKDSGHSTAVLLSMANLPVLAGNNARVAGWTRLREWMQVYDELHDAIDNETGAVVKVVIPVSRIRVFTTCRQIIRTLPNLVTDERNIEDLDTDGEDHLADALRYLVMQLPTMAALGKYTYSVENKDENMQSDDTWRANNGLVPRERHDDTGERTTGW